MSIVSIDFEKVKRASAYLRQNPPTKEEISADPKAFLAKHGVQISDEMSQQIKDRLSTSPIFSDQASVLHIDT